MLIERRTLDNKDARTLKERSTASKTQNALNLWNVLKTKDGRDLPIICCCLDELGHGDIAQDLLQSTPEELMDYFEEEVRLQWENILDALERQQKSLDESNEKLEKITEHLQECKGANNGSQLLEEIKEMRLDIKSLLSSREDEKKFLQDLVREKNIMAEELEVKTKLYDQSQKELAQLQGNLRSVKSQLEEIMKKKTFLEQELEQLKTSDLKCIIEGQLNDLKDDMNKRMNEFRQNLVGWKAVQHVEMRSGCGETSLQTQKQAQSPHPMSENRSNKFEAPSPRKLWRPLNSLFGDVN
ncbi:unnamed protein product [Darwinula stevensoni]|uniref:Uncharacterized protein n=1 Tax=Darwinula stevensoni TaxID=69355 RepID=A0A7R9AEY4_9CRUS|nr:unnamed protein product [Darwinula stevensoni]CAG0902796.1 unnamed protein product [Darwinula stevensoni]